MAVHYSNFLKPFHSNISAIHKKKSMNIGRNLRLKVKKYNVDGVLFDAYQENAFGGTGKTFNWELLKQADIKVPFILSGGLNQENILDAVKTVKPYAVDVSSGVELEPGKKDHRKMMSFIKNAKLEE